MPITLFMETQFNLRVDWTAADITQKGESIPVLCGLDDRVMMEVHRVVLTLMHSVTLGQLFNISVYIINLRLDCIACLLYFSYCVFSCLADEYI